MKTLAEVQRLAAIIGAKPSLLPTFGSTEDFARPHIEVDAKNYHYVVVERGKEYLRHTTDDLDDILYQVFQSVTFAMSCEYELMNRIERQDFRRILWQHQDKLLTSISSGWAIRRATGQRMHLLNHPFQDDE